MSGFYLCFECDHRQAVPGACQVCRGSCELIGALDSRRFGRFIVIEGGKGEDLNATGNRSDAEKRRKDAKDGV